MLFHKTELHANGSAWIDFSSEDLYILLRAGAKIKDFELTRTLNL